jgi:hypothetical protein
MRVGPLCLWACVRAVEARMYFGLSKARRKGPHVPRGGAARPQSADFFAIGFDGDAARDTESRRKRLFRTECWCIGLVQATSQAVDVVQVDTASLA